MEAPSSRYTVVEVSSLPIRSTYPLHRLFALDGVTAAGDDGPQRS